MPKPPKNGMVIAPKTEHGMKARFRCKDGFNLTAPGGREITDPNEFVMTCSFGNWTGHIPYCQEVYCAHPGYIPNGKVFLVGNMGLYDYRPYVRKVRGRNIIKLSQSIESFSLSLSDHEQQTNHVRLRQGIRFRPTRTARSDLHWRPVEAHGTAQMHVGATSAATVEQKEEKRGIVQDAEGAPIKGVP